MNILMGIILGGTILMVVFMYLLMILLLAIKAKNGEMKSDSKGIKNLKFQEYNPTWSRWVENKL